MKKIYFCPNCYETFGSEEGGKYECPKCNCQLVETKYSRDKWRSYTEKEKLNIKNELKEEYKINCEINNIKSNENTKKESYNSSCFGVKIKSVAKLFYELSIIFNGLIGILLVTFVNSNNIKQFLESFNVNVLYIDILIVLLIGILIYISYVSYLLLVGYGTIVDSNELYLKLNNKEK